MPSVKVRTFIHRGKIAAMNLPGGDIYKFGRNFAREVEVIAVLYAPKRTGALAASIRADAVGGNQSGIDARVFAHADHASYVHEGTAGGKYGRGIYPKSGPWLALPREGRWRGSAQPWVRGQDANPFLRRALDHAMKTSPYIT